MKNDVQNWIYREVPEPYNDFFKQIEAALGFKLFIWQKTFIMRGVFRQYGETTTKILRELLQTTAKPLDYTRPPHSKREEIYRRELRNIQQKLNNAGIKTRVVFYCKQDKRAYKETADELRAEEAFTEEGAYINV